MSADILQDLVMVMEYGVLQHVRQSRSGSEGMLEDYCFSAFSEGIIWPNVHRVSGTVCLISILIYVKHLQFLPGCMIKWKTVKRLIMTISHEQMACESCYKSRCTFGQITEAYICTCKFFLEANTWFFAWRFSLAWTYKILQNVCWHRSFKVYRL
jgi:hypothetical protein